MTLTKINSPPYVQAPWRLIAPPRR